MIHVDVWERGTVTAFYVRERLNGFAPDARMTYLFTEDGLHGGGACPASQDWQGVREDIRGR